MHILITGAAGMIGRKLTARLLADGALGDRPVTKLTLHDVVPPNAEPTSQTSILPIVGDIADYVLAERLILERPDVIVHLAAVVSGEAETEFAKGYASNLDGTRYLFDAVRAANYNPRIVYASSIAVFGAPFPDRIPDEFHCTPLTSYGTQKLIGEALLADYTRRGFFDGIGLRLPTICVRPGAPNKAASGFFSSIIREPLNGEAAVLPVSDTVRHTHASPRAAVGFFLHAATMDLAAVGPRRNVIMPGLSCTVAEQIEALREVAGEKAVSLIRHEPDDLIARIVSGWAEAFEARRARDLGFRAETDFTEIVRVHIDDELDGNPPVTG